MDRCPTELILRIFSMACTDGGQTGCALSLVSKDVHEVADRVRLNSIALQSPFQLETFHTFLLQRKPEKRIVRHLFITPQSGNSYLNPLWNDRGWERILVNCDSASDIAIKIISLLAPFIRNLAIIRVHLPNLFPFSFPELREITVHCIRIPSKFLSGAQTAPKVERIAISSDAPSPLSAQHPAKEFARVSPQVTHLCLHEAMANKTTEFTDQLEDLWAFVRENQRRLGVQTDREQRHELRKKKDFVFAPMFIVHDRLRRHFGCSPPSPSPERDENEQLEDNLRLYPTNLSSSYYSSSNFEANWMARIFGAPGLWEEKVITEY